MKIKKLDRECIFIENPKPKYLWCLHCERAYKYGEYRQVGDLQLCPYENCGGDTVMDARDWNHCRREDEPIIPEHGKFYSEYREGNFYKKKVVKKKLVKKNKIKKPSEFDIHEVLGGWVVQESKPNGTYSYRRYKTFIPAKRYKYKQEQAQKKQ